MSTFILSLQYYFDSFISSFYTLIESEQENELCKYLNNKKIRGIFPNRKSIDLFWQVYMLRNRIIHFTEARYDNTEKECKRFYDFSSKITNIYIDNNGEIHIKSTLIDVNKNDEIQKAVKQSIKDNSNPFDILFPNKKAKGYGKKNPFISYITNDIFFDYVDSSVDLINQIHSMLHSINLLFLECFMHKDNNKNETIKSRTRIVYNNKEIDYSIQEVFYKDNKNIFL